MLDTDNTGARRRTCGRRVGTRSASVVAVVLASLASLAGPASAAPGAPPLVVTDTVDVDFGPVAAGATAGQTVQVTNLGPGTATGLLVLEAAPATFARTGGTCATSLAAGATCTVDLTYTPTGLVTQHASVRIVADGGTATRVYLRGRPDPGPFPLRVTRTSLDFGPSAIGATTAAQTVEVANTTAAPVSFTLSATPPPAPFSADAPGCSGSPVVLAPGASCTLGSRAHPVTPTVEATATVDLDLAVVAGPSRTVPVDLRSVGASPAANPVRITPRRIDFGSLALGQTSAPQEVTFTNASTVGQTVRVQVGHVAGLADAGSCTGDLAPGASCTIAYTATPTVEGTSTIEDQPDVIIPGRLPYQVPLTYSMRGEGSSGVLDVDRRDLALGVGTDASPGPDQVVTVSNHGSAPFTDLALAFPTPELRDDGTCGSSLAAGASCTFAFHSTTSTLGLDQATITAGDQRQSVLVRYGRPWTVHQAFVGQLNLDFLGAPLNSTTRSTLVSGLDAGTLTRSQVVGQYPHDPAYTTNLVRQLYRATLDRNGDTKGLAYWSGQLSSGRRSVAEVTAEFYGSGEYYQRVGGTDEAFVTDLYLRLLHRGSDPGGLAFWTGQVAAKGRVRVARILFDSLESRRDRVRFLYRALLLRDVDPQGRDYWAARILERGDLVLAASLAASDEYLRFAQDVQRTIL